MTIFREVSNPKKIVYQNEILTAGITVAKKLYIIIIKASQGSKN